MPKQNKNILLDSIGPFEQIRSVVSEKDRMVSKAGQEIIQNLLKSELGYSGRIPPGFSWLIKNDMGLFSTRFKKLLTDYWCLENGNLIRALTERAATIAAAYSDDNDIIFDLTRDLQWQRGDFGNPYSCLWTDYPRSRAYIAHGGGWGAGFGIRIFKSASPDTERRLWYSKFVGSVS